MRSLVSYWMENGRRTEGMKNDCAVKRHLNVTNCFNYLVVTFYLKAIRADSQCSGQADVFVGKRAILQARPPAHCIVNWPLVKRSCRYTAKRLIFFPLSIHQPSYWLLRSGFLTSYFIPIIFSICSFSTVACSATFLSTDFPFSPTVSKAFAAPRSLFSIRCCSDCSLKYALLRI